ncbi:hypothetical protein CERSUDRAFT_110051 [Gelatoporia subvermispora B]|uniref:Dihydrolipoamide acetyltransferase component of pyruvate dehydrogenase complex n=1 Tax=Ceriporiopsis subvermispora (strain B) TaxID=914234 RepID=M2PXB0_CERS8|nr:hypothetical protein CERSUDRAFT_110051 [Gelatoporia subvermispora B]
MQSCRLRSLRTLRYIRSLQHAAAFHTSPLWYAGKSVRPFKLADIGEGITECEVIKWNVKPASTVQAFDPLCEVQSDKASVEITSPFDGTVKELLVKEGDVAKVGATLCTIEVEGEATDDIQSPNNNSDLPSDKEASSPDPAQQQVPPPSAPPAQRVPPHPLDPNVPAEARAAASYGSNDVLATPSIRHYARQKGVDLESIAPGSGKSGRIEKRDVDNFLSSLTPSKAPSSRAERPQDDIVVALGRTRHNMWKAMVKSLEIPQFGCSTEFDLTALHEMLPVLNAHIPVRFLPSEKHASQPGVSPSTFYQSPGVAAVADSGRYTRLTYLPILLKMLSRAMMEWPLFRSSITPGSDQPSESSKPTMTLRPHADINIAMSTPTGLYTPTIQAADTASVYTLASQLKHLSHLGRQTPCGLTPAEMPKRGGTVSVSNVGGIGDVKYASPVLVPGGGVAIVAIGRAHWVWDVEHGDGSGQRRLKVGISWSADHRIVEGAELIAFSESWKGWVQSPQRLLADSV